MAEPESSFTGVDAQEFARNVRKTSDKHLEELMRTSLRGGILDEIFSRMERHFRPEQASGADGAIHFRIGGREDGGHDVYEVVLRDGTLTVRDEPAEDPRVTVSVKGADFLKLATGNANGPTMFLRRKLKVSGDLGLAARLPGLFSIPKG